MYYTIKIKPASLKEEILFTTDEGEKNGNQDEILGFSFKMNSLVDNAQDRDKHARCEMRVLGLIDERTFERTAKLADWSQRTKNFFATVEVEVSASNNAEDKKVLRRYTFDKMFCVDYSESFDLYRDERATGGGGETGTFELFMAQSPTHEQSSILTI